MKKVWEKPKLVALVRGKPEERVLQVCKGIGLEGPVTMGCGDPSADGCEEFSTT